MGIGHKVHQRCPQVHGGFWVIMSPDRTEKGMLFSKEVHDSCQENKSWSLPLTRYFNPNFNWGGLINTQCSAQCPLECSGETKGQRKKLCKFFLFCFKRWIFNLILVLKYPLHFYLFSLKQFCILKMISSECEWVLDILTHQKPQFGNLHLSTLYILE